jgi:hypothetical protein
LISGYISCKEDQPSAWKTVREFGRPSKSHDSR